MKFFSWMQNKLQNGKGNAKPNASSSASHHTNPEQRKEECSDWHHGLLTIGTFGNNDLKENQASQSVEDDEQCVSPDLAEFTPEEVGKLEKELTKLLSRKPAAAKVVGDIANLPLDRFLNCPSSLEVDRRLSNTLCSDSNNRDEEEDIDRTIRVILGRCRDACMERNNKSLGKKSVSFLLKKMFVCASGFAPAPDLRDAFHESRMEKLMRTMLSKKMYPQNASRASSVKRYIEDGQQPKTSSAKQDETEEQPNVGGSKWDKTDSDYIVLEI